MCAAAKHSLCDRDTVFANDARVATHSEASKRTARAKVTRVRKVPHVVCNTTRATNNIPFVMNRTIFFGLLGFLGEARVVRLCAALKHAQRIT